MALCLLICGAGASGVAVADEPGPYCPSEVGEGDIRGQRFDTSVLEGKTVRRARSIARKHGCHVRVVRRDGESPPVTDDFSPQRINVSVACGRVRRVVGVF